MGSCLSNDKKPDDKEELSCQENRQTKIESAQLRRVAQMNPQEKLDYMQSLELTDYLRLCGSSKNNALKDALQQIAPTDNDQLIKYIKSTMAKLQLQKDKTPPTNNPNHSQYTSVVHQYFLKLEQPLADYMKEKSHQNSTLQECFYVTEKTLHVLLTLQDADIKSEEKWWGTGDNHTSLFTEMENCAGLFDANVKKLATDYLSDLYSNLNLAADKGDPISQVLRGYFPKLYKQAIDIVASRH